MHFALDFGTSYHARRKLFQIKHLLLQILQVPPPIQLNECTLYSS
jgi:hypothetical protein